MFIAGQLRKKSIAEYVLYMWQTEDLVRAYGCSLPRIRREYISQFAYDAGQKEELADWYGNIIRMMNQEGCREKGHIQINRSVVDEMNDVHRRLLHSTRYHYYEAEYYKVLPYIVELRSKSEQPDGEIETCLSALYGTMMLRLQGKEISEATEQAVKEISTFIGMLSDYYLKDKAEGLDPD